MERERAGIADLLLEHAKRPLNVHLEEWFDSLEQRELTDRRRVEIPQRMRKLVGLAGWQRLTDINADSVQRCLNQLGVSAQTRNHYLQHLKQFLRWCIPERLEFNPIAKISRANVDTDPRHQRRELNESEKAKLLTSTANGPTRFGLDGASRKMLHAMALGTGFRAGELRSLTRESFDLDKSTVTLAARHSKHRRSDVQPIPPWLLGWLRTWFAEDRPLWPDLTPHTAKMIRADLEEARIPYVVERVDGRKFADFHALRHTFSSDVARTHAPVKDMMELTRHSTAQLFLNRYAKTTTENKARCVNQLADPLANAQEPTAMTD